MGIYSEYLEKFSSGSFEEFSAERKNQLKKISKLRGRDVLVFAADINKGIQQISIDYSDLLPFTDQLSNLKGKQLDLILETPGGSGEVAEDLVKAIRAQYDRDRWFHVLSTTCPATLWGSLPVRPSHQETKK
jgi:ClpP class serine protease